MKISIIIPIFNVPKEWLLRLYKKMLFIKNNNVEIIFINDCSSDKETLYLLKKISKNFKVINNGINKGLGESRNIGINNSSCEYIWFIDGDDDINEVSIKYLLEEINNKEKDDVIFFKYCEDYNNKSIILNCKDNNIFFYNWAVWNKIYRKDFLVSNNIFFIKDKIYHEDLYFTFLVISLCKKRSFINKTFYFYNKRNNNSITNNCKYMERLESIVIVLSKINDFLRRAKTNDLWIIRNKYVPLYIDLVYNEFSILSYKKKNLIRKKFRDVFYDKTFIKMIKKEINILIYIYIYILYKQPIFFLSVILFNIKKSIKK